MRLSVCERSLPLPLGGGEGRSEGASVGGLVAASRCALASGGDQNQFFRQGPESRVRSFVARIFPDAKQPC